MPHLTYRASTLRVLLSSALLSLSVACSPAGSGRAGGGDGVDPSVPSSAGEPYANRLILDGEELITDDASYTLAKDRERDRLGIAGAYETGAHERDVIDISVLFEPMIQPEQSIDFSAHLINYDAKMEYIALSQLPTDKSIKFYATEGTITFSYDSSNEVVEGTFNAVLQNFDSSDIIERSGSFRHKIAWKCFDTGAEGELIVLDADRDEWCLERRSMLE